MKKETYLDYPNLKEGVFCLSDVSFYVRQRPQDALLSIKQNENEISVFLKYDELKKIVDNISNFIL